MPNARQPRLSHRLRHTVTPWFGMTMMLVGCSLVGGCRSAPTLAPPDTVVSKANPASKMLALLNEVRWPGSPVATTSRDGYLLHERGKQNTGSQSMGSLSADSYRAIGDDKTSSPFRLASSIELGKPPESSAEGLHEDHTMLLRELEQTLANQHDPAAEKSRLSLRESSMPRIFRGAKGDNEKPFDPHTVVDHLGPDRGHADQQHALKPFSGWELPADPWRLTESEMLTLALNNSPVLRPLGVQIIDNPDAVTTRYDVAIEATDPFFGPQAALADFDARLRAGVTAQNNDRVFNNAILGGAAQELVQDTTAFNTGWQKRTRSGATFDLGVDHSYDNNNRAGNLFPNYWETQWQAGIRQPLLQGAGRKFNLIAGPNAQPGFRFSRGIVIAKLNVKVSEADFQIKVRDFVRDLYQTYWDLQQRYQTYEQIRIAEQLAHRTWQTVQAKRQASVSGGDAHKEAQSRARYYSFRRQRRSALDGNRGQSGLYGVERRLRYMMGLPIVDGRLLQPIDEPVSVRFSFDFDSLVHRATTQRTEVHRQSLRLRQQELKWVASKNFMLPQLDMIGRYRMRGFGDDLIGKGDRFASAYNDFFSREHQEWEFGLEMGVTAGRRQARAAVRNASLQVQRERQLMKELRRAIRHEVADAYGEVQSSFESMETSTAQVEAATERLQASIAQYEADQLPIEFLLDAQAELLRAQTQRSEDQTRYTTSLVAIGVATGSLLHDVGLHIADHACGKDLVFFGQ